MKKDDMVEITEAEEGFFSVGDKARLVSQYSDGGWLADFTMNDKYEGDGEWYIGGIWSQCKLIGDAA